MTDWESHDIVWDMKLSYSALSKYSECPERFKRERMLGLGPGWEYTPQSARGTIVHKFMEGLISSKLSTDSWPSENDAEWLMEDLWTNGFPIQEDSHTNILKACVWLPEFLEKSTKDSILLVPQIYRDILPMLDPIGAEVHLELDLPNAGNEINKLHGYIDCLAQPNFVIDWKTRTSAINERWLDTDLQATVYAALAGYPKTTVQFVQFIFLKTKPPRIEVATTHRDQRHTDWLLNELIPPIIEQIENDIMGPTPGWWCTNCPVKCGAYPDLEMKI